LFFGGGRRDFDGPTGGRDGAVFGRKGKKPFGICGKKRKKKNEDGGGPGGTKTGGGTGRNTAQVTLQWGPARGGGKDFPGRGGRGAVSDFGGGGGGGGGGVGRGRFGAPGWACVH